MMTKSEMKNGHNNNVFVKPRQVYDNPKYFYRRINKVGTICECGYTFKEEDQLFQEMNPGYSQLLTICPKCQEEYYA